MLIAPTATGKTEAALLPILHKLIMLLERLPGIKVLYITPLRALNRDLLERLTWWCERLDIKIAVRHGDTEARERAQQARSPPDLLITTPETLQAILVGKVMRKHLRSVRWVIVDEVHELACDKRGSQLSLALERLRWIKGAGRREKGDFQVIGLSATIGSPEKVAKFLVGTGNECEIVKVPVARGMKLQVLYPKPSPEDYELAAKLYTHPEVAARLRIVRELIEKHRSILLFTNTRAISEVLASRFKVWDIDLPLSIHHGSLSKASRVMAEQGLKHGELRALVCTSSLELGIDIGRIDMCIQYNSPRQVTRLLQRVGRSGHRIGRIAKGVIIAIDSDDALEAFVIARRALIEDLEEVAAPEKPLDALAHQIAGMLATRGRWNFDDILEIFRDAYPYRDLTEEELEGVLSYMHTRYPRFLWASFEDKIFLKPRRTKALYEYYFGNLSMIPEEKQYLVIDETTDTPVALLDEVFVAEYGEPGTKFICRGSPWRITQVYGERVYVRPVSDPTGAIPSWVGEEIPVPFEVALEVGEIRRFVEEKLKAGAKVSEIATELAKQYPAGVGTIRRAIQETVEHIKRGYPAPTDRRIVVEKWREYTIIHASFGSLVNRALARLVGHVLSEELGYAVGVQQDPYRIVVQTFETIAPQEIKRILLDLGNVQDLRGLAREAIVKTGLFKRRLLHVAQKFGAVPESVSFTRLGLRQLLKSFEGTAIHEEAIKDTFLLDLDVDRAGKVLRAIKDGKIEVICIEPEESTPLAAIGMERIGRKTDLIPPERLSKVILESAKARLLSEVMTFVCTSCWSFARMIRVKDLPSDVKCPQCGSRRLGALKECEEADLQTLIERKGVPRNARERDLVQRARRTAQLIADYGKAAAIALAGKRLRVIDVEDILWEERNVTDRLFELIIEAEKRVLKRRFW